uniref:Uncharacterized protein At2g24330 n=2 Tax=Anthurium amnicola TaxID=1678845 RepID=A0A1D1Y3A0_9ARAE
MAEDGKEDAAAAGDSAGTKPSVSGERKQQRKGILARIWHGIFRGRDEDFEKRLQHLSKEEASVHARLQRRAHLWRKAARNIIVCSVLLEVIAVAYAVITTRSVDLNWQMRAIRVLPMFVLPILSSAIYAMLANLTRMFDRRDQKMLERLRAERQAKIDELKERTNYYTTQQLIQRYDLDPAAKAAAAAVLASKLGADTGLKVYVGDESKSNVPLGKSNDAQLVQSDGLRNRKQPHSRSQSTGSSTLQQFVSEVSPEVGPDGQAILAPTRRMVEHYSSPGTNDGGWIARIAAMLVGEDPTQCYALICGNCRMHNGLARKEDYPYVTYYCPHCHALNGPRQSAEIDSGPDSGKTSDLAPVNAITRNVSNASSSAETEVTSNLATVQEPVLGSNPEDSGLQTS